MYVVLQVAMMDDRIPFQVYVLKSLWVCGLLVVTALFPFVFVLSFLLEPWTWKRCPSVSCLRWEDSVHTASCWICLEPEGTLRILRSKGCQCRVPLHLSCWNHWVQFQQTEDAPLTCPLCRAPVS